MDFSPLYVTLGEKSLKDTIEINPDDIYKFVDENKILPKTSAGTITDYTNFFSKYVNEGYEVIHICISSTMSCSYQNASIAAEEVGHCHVIDSQNLSTASGHLAIMAAELAAEGKEAEEIVKILKETVPKVRGSFIVSVMDYLKNLRLAKAKKLLAKTSLPIFEPSATTITDFAELIIFLAREASFE